MKKTTIELPPIYSILTRTLIENQCDADISYSEDAKYILVYSKPKKFKLLKKWWSNEITCTMKDNNPYFGYVLLERPDVSNEYILKDLHKACLHKFERTIGKQIDDETEWIYAVILDPELNDVNGENSLNLLERQFGNLALEEICHLLTHGYPDVYYDKQEIEDSEDKVSGLRDYFAKLKRMTKSLGWIKTPLLLVSIFVMMIVSASLGSLLSGVIVDNAQFVTSMLSGNDEIKPQKEQPISSASDTSSSIQQTGGGSTVITVTPTETPTPTVSPSPTPTPTKGPTNTPSPFPTGTLRDDIRAARGIPQAYRDIKEVYEKKGIPEDEIYFAIGMYVFLSQDLLNNPYTHYVTYGSGCEQKIFDPEEWRERLAKNLLTNKNELQNNTQKIITYLQETYTKEVLTKNQIRAGLLIIATLLFQDCPMKKWKRPIKNDNEPEKCFELNYPAGCSDKNTVFYRIEAFAGQTPHIDNGGPITKSRTAYANLLKDPPIVSDNFWYKMCDNLIKNLEKN